MISEFSLYVSRQDVEEVHRSRQLRINVNHTSLMSRGNLQSTLVRHLQHRGILRQHLCDEPLETGLPGKNDEMTQQRRADAFSLISIDHHESDFCLRRSRHDVAGASGDGGLSSFL